MTWWNTLLSLHLGFLRVLYSFLTKFYGLTVITLFSDSSEIKHWPSRYDCQGARYDSARDYYYGFLKFWQSTWQTKPYLVDLTVLPDSARTEAPARSLGFEQPLGEETLRLDCLWVSSMLKIGAAQFRSVGVQSLRPSSILVEDLWKPMFRRF